MNSEELTNFIESVSGQERDDCDSFKITVIIHPKREVRPFNIWDDRPREEDKIVVLLIPKKRSKFILKKIKDGDIEIIEVSFLHYLKIRQDEVEHYRKFELFGQTYFIDLEFEDIRYHTISKAGWVKSDPIKIKRKLPEKPKLTHSVIINSEVFTRLFGIISHYNG